MANKGRGSLCDTAQRNTLGQCVTLRRLEGKRSKTKEEGKIKMDHKHTPKQGTQPSLDLRLRARSGIETLRRSPEVNGEGENNPTQREKEKQKQDKEIRMKHTNLLKRSWKGYTQMSMVSATPDTSTPSLTITRYVAPTIAAIALDWET